MRSVRNFKLIFVLLVGLIATGCPKSSPDLNLDDKSVKESAIYQLKANVFKYQFAEYQCWKSGRVAVAVFADSSAQGQTGGKGKGGGQSPNTNSLDEYVGLNCSTDAADAQVAESKAQEIRNRVFEEAKVLVDEAYGKYADALRERRSIGNFLADLLELGVGSAIGITNGRARTFQILGVALTSVKGARKSADLNLYDEQTTEVILDKMDSARNSVYLRFQNVERNKSTKDFSFEAALGILYEYFRVGTQTEAFKRIRRDAAVDADVKEKQVLKLKDFPQQSIFAPTEEVSVAAATITEIRNRYIKIIRLDSQVAPNKEAQDKLSENLKKVFDEINTGSLAASFAPYWDKVKLVPNKEYKQYFEKLSSTDAAQKDSVTVAQRLELLLELYKQIFAEADDSKKNPLILAFKEALLKNQ